jgi:ribosome-associated protein
MLRVTAGIILDDHDVEERFVRSIGPASQNRRKEETAVELRLDIGASSLPADMKERLRALGAKTVTRDGVLVVVSRVHRAQADNREAARARLLAILRHAANPPAKRRLTRPRRAVTEARLASKRQRSAVKQSRSPGRE